MIHLQTDLGAGFLNKVLIIFFSNKLQDLQTNLNVVKRDVDLFMFKELPALIKNSCTQQITRVLKGDYDLKIARQDYFIGNQDQVRCTIV